MLFSTLVHLSPLSAPNNHFASFEMPTLMARESIKGWRRFTSRKLHRLMKAGIQVRGPPSVAGMPPRMAYMHEVSDRGGRQLLMPLAFVMINVKVGTDLQVVSELQTMKNVIGVHEVYSVYDIVAEVKVDTMEELEGINSKIRHLANIISTHTMVVAEKMSAGIFNS